VRRFISTRPWLAKHDVGNLDEVFPGGLTGRDYAYRRPVAPTVNCPECQAEYPRELVRALGEMRCGPCQRRVAFKANVGMVLLDDFPPAKVEQVPELPPPPAEAITSRLKRYVRGDAAGKTTTTLRTSDTELDEWREAAEAAGMTLNGYLRRLVNEGVDLDRLNALPDHDHPKRKDT
jgi:hypothetical protein